MSLLTDLDLRLPIIQAPMAGVSTPDLAAAVSNAGGLGSLGVGATDADGAAQVIDAIRARTNRAFNINVFVHSSATPDPAREATWLDAMRPLFAAQNAAPPSRLRPLYRSFNEDDAMLDILVARAPAVVSFHFGLPQTDRIARLKSAGCRLLATATNLGEAEAARAAGIDAIVAQGIEAGGHRGVVDPDAPDPGLGTLALTRLLVAKSGLPVIAAGGIMDGAGIRTALELGAIAAQLGTAFIACPESAADDGYRAALTGPGANHTAMTRVISGRPARCLGNQFTAWGAGNSLPAPDYPITYDAGKALHAAASTNGEHGYGAHWAGQGAPLARTLPAAELMTQLAVELRAGLPEAHDYSGE